jgi:hypothetical protein
MGAETEMNTRQDTVAADEPGNRTFAMVVRLRFALETGSLQRIRRAKLPANSAGLELGFPADFEVVTAAAAGFCVNHVQVKKCESDQREDSIRESSGGWSSDRASTPQEISEAPGSRSAGDSRNPGEGILRTRDFGPGSGPVLPVERQRKGFLFGPALRPGAPNSKVTDSGHRTHDGAGANRQHDVWPGRVSRVRRLGPATDLDEAGCPTPAEVPAQPGFGPPHAADQKAGWSGIREDDPRSDAAGGRECHAAGIRSVNSPAVSAAHAAANPQSAATEIRDNVGRAVLCGIQCTDCCRPAAIRCAECIPKSVGFAANVHSDRAKSAVDSSGFSPPTFSENARGMPAGYPSADVVRRGIIRWGKHTGANRPVSAIPCAVTLERAADFAVVGFSSSAKIADAACKIVSVVVLPYRPMRTAEHVDSFVDAKGRLGVGKDGAARGVRPLCRDSQDAVGDFIFRETNAEFASAGNIREPKPLGDSGLSAESHCGAELTRAHHRVFLSFYQTLRSGEFSQTIAPPLKPIRKPKPFDTSGPSIKSHCVAAIKASFERAIVFGSLKSHWYFGRTAAAYKCIRRGEVFPTSSLVAKSPCSAGLSTRFDGGNNSGLLKRLVFFRPVFEVEKHIRRGEVFDTSCHFRCCGQKVSFSAARSASRQGDRKPFIFSEFFAILSDSFAASIHIRQAKLSGTSCPGAAREFSGVCASESFAAPPFSGVNSGEYLTEINLQKSPDFLNAISRRASSESITGINADALPDPAISDLSESIAGINAQSSPKSARLIPVNSSPELMRVPVDSPLEQTRLADSSIRAFPVRSARKPACIAIVRRSRPPVCARVRAPPRESFRYRRHPAIQARFHDGRQIRIPR